MPFGYCSAIPGILQIVLQTAYADQAAAQKAAMNHRSNTKQEGVIIDGECEDVTEPRQRMVTDGHQQHDDPLNDRHTRSRQGTEFHQGRHPQAERIQPADAEKEADEEKEEMKKPLKVAMPMKAAKAAGGKTTMEKAKAGKHKSTGVNALMNKASIPQTQAKVTFGQKTPTQKS